MRRVLALALPPCLLPPRPVPRQERGEPVKGAVVRFKGRRKRTNARGIARMKVRLEKPRRGRVAKQIGCTKRRAAVRVRLR